jgi:nucleoside-diphosphate-sugar epimerase
MEGKIFLTGATGFVGSALLKRFLADGAMVRVLVRNELIGLQDEKKKGGGRVEKIVGDLLSLCQIQDRALDDALFVRSGKIFNYLLGYDVVVHAAARAHIIRDEVANPLVEYRKVNRDATLALARFAAQAGVKRFVFISTIGVNGNSNNRPFTANDVPYPHDAYSLSKFEAEQGLLEIAQQTGMEAVIVRSPLVYGVNAPGNFGSLVKWVKKGLPLPFGAVRNMRSFVALNNLVDFIALCADLARSPKAANELFLISDGEDVSTSDLLRKVAKACGVKSRLLKVPVGLMTIVARLSGKGATADRLLGNLQVDSSKAHDLLGWKPVVTMDEELAQMFNS